MEHSIKRYVKKVSRVMETFYIKDSCSNEWISNIWDIYTISITLMKKTEDYQDATFVHVCSFFVSMATIIN